MLPSPEVGVRLLPEKEEAAYDQRQTMDCDHHRSHTREFQWKKGNTLEDHPATPWRALQNKNATGQLGHGSANEQARTTETMEPTNRGTSGIRIKTNEHQEQNAYRA